MSHNLLSSVLTKTNHSISIDIKQLKGRLVKGIGVAQQPLECLKFRVGNEAILASVDDRRQHIDGLHIVVISGEQTQVLPDEVLGGHKSFAVLLNRRMLVEYRQ